MPRRTLLLIILSAVLVTTDIWASGLSKAERAFRNHEWTEILPTDLGDNESLPPPAFPPFWPNVGHWDPRAGLEVVQLHNLIFMIGGRTPIPNAGFASIIQGDVWVSDDLGQSWGPILIDPFDEQAWPNRAYHEAVTKGKYMYVMGGQNFGTTPGDGCADQSIFFNDVWRSKDGFNWKQLKANTPNEDGTHWPARAGHSVIKFKGKLWVLGGSQGDDVSIGGCGRTLFNDVWYSSDGKTWTEATADVDKDDPEKIWRPRAGAAVVVKNGWLYVLGGENAFLPSEQNPVPYYNDVWRTRDGKRWQEVTRGYDPSERWSPRPGHTCSVLNRYIVCFGGYGPFGNPSDVWVSRYGFEWHQISDSPWNNDPGFICVPNPPETTCDNIRYDYDTLVVQDGRRYKDQAIYTFGGDRELFPVPPLFMVPDDNWKRVENDVWRFGPAKQEK